MDFREKCACGQEIFIACPTCEGPLCGTCAEEDKCPTCDVGGIVLKDREWGELSMFMPGAFGSQCIECDTISSLECKKCDVDLCLRHGDTHKCSEPDSVAATVQKDLEKALDTKEKVIRVRAQKTSIEHKKTETTKEGALALKYRAEAGKLEAERNKITTENNIEVTKIENAEREANIKTLDLEAEFDRKTMYSYENLLAHMKRVAYGKSRLPKTFIPQMKAAAEAFFMTALENDPVIKLRDFSRAVKECVPVDRDELDACVAVFDDRGAIELQDALDGVRSSYINFDKIGLGFIERWFGPVRWCTQVIEKPENSQAWENTPRYPCWAKVSMAALTGALSLLLIADHVSCTTSNLCSPSVVPLNIVTYRYCKGIITPA